MICFCLINAWDSKSSECLLLRWMSQIKEAFASLGLVSHSHWVDFRGTNCFRMASRRSRAKTASFLTTYDCTKMIVRFNFGTQMTLHLHYPVSRQSLKYGLLWDAWLPACKGPSLWWKNWLPICYFAIRLELKLVHRENPMMTSLTGNGWNHRLADLHRPSRSVARRWFLECSRFSAKVRGRSSLTGFQ